MSGARAVQGPVEDRELRVSADESRRVRLDRRVELADHAVRDHGLGLPLQHDRIAALELESVHREPSRRLAHEHLAERGRGLETLRGIHRVADDRVRALDVAREQARDDLAGVHPDPKREPHAVRPIEVVVQVEDRGLHRERGVDRALRIVLVRDRRAEYGHDRVTDVLVDRPLVPLDLAREGPEVAAEDRPQLLRVELLRERRRAGEIREEDGHDLPLLEERLVRLGGDLERGARRS